MKTQFITVLLLAMGMLAIAQNDSKKSKWTALNYRQRYLPHFEGNHELRIDLNQNDKLFIEFDNVQDLRKYQNIDSLIRQFVLDFEEINDTTVSTTDSRRVHYNLQCDNCSKRQMTIKRYKSDTEFYRFQTGKPTNLIKMGQDTLTLTLQNRSDDNYKTTGGRFNYILIVNKLEDLVYFAKAGLNDRISTLIDRMEQHPKGDMFAKNRHIYGYWPEQGIEPKIRTRVLPVISYSSSEIATNSIGAFMLNGEIGINFSFDFNYMIGFTNKWKTDAISVFVRQTTYILPRSFNNAEFNRSNTFLELGVSFYNVGRQSPNLSRSIYNPVRQADVSIGYSRFEAAAGNRSRNIFDTDILKISGSLRLSKKTIAGIDLMGGPNSDRATIGLRLGFSL